MKLQSLIEQLDYDISRHEKNLNEWLEKKFKQDPAYAFEWSAGMFEEAARLRVKKEVRAWIDNGMAEDFRKFINDASEELLKRAERELQSPSRSTSQQSNEMARCIASESYTFSKHLKRMEKI